MFRQAGRIIALACVCGLVMLPASAGTVTDLGDSGPGTLRQAIADAISGETITFQVIGTIGLNSGELTIDKDLTIWGPGLNQLTVSGQSLSRVFSVEPGARVSITGLTITNGRVEALGALGGGIFNEGILSLFDVAVVTCMAVGLAGEPGGNAQGGGVYNSGMLMINNSSFSANSATGGDSTTLSGGMGTGGALANDLSGTVDAQACLFAGNSATGGNSVVFSGASTGGAIGQYAGSGAVACTNCTFYGNHAASPAMGLGTGGAAYGADNFTFTHCTLAGNSAQGQGGGIYSSDGAGPGLRACIVANNGATGLGPDLCGTFQSLDFNLIRVTTDATLTGAVLNNLTGVDPLLGGMVDNGGPTQTLALLDGSPALDYIPQPECTAFTDQRGTIRPQNSACDIGAFEKGYFACITLNGPMSPTNADDLNFLVSFNAVVNNSTFNDIDDLVITTTGALAYTGVSGFAGGMNLSVVVNGVTGDGTIAMTVNTASDVESGSGDPLVASVTSAPVIVDNSPPAIAIGNPSEIITITGPVTFDVTYTDADIITLTESDVSLNATGTANGLATVNGSGPIMRTVVVDGITGEGTLSISLAAGTAADALGNLSEAAGPSAAVNVGVTMPVASWTGLGLGVLAGAAWLARRRK